MSGPWCHGPGFPVDPMAVVNHPLAAVGLVAWVVLLGQAPRDRAALVIGAVALAARWLSGGPRIHYHLDRAYRVMVQATGGMSPDNAYGDGQTALMFWPHVISGGSADAVPVAQIVLGSLAAPHLLGALRPAFGEDAARAAALALALAPLPAVMSTTETPYVGVMTLCAAAAHGLAGRGRGPDALLAVSAGLVAHLRPFEGLATAAFAAAAVHQRRHLAAAVAASFAALRLALWASAPPGLGGALGEGWAVALHAPWAGAGGRVVALDPTTTPAALAALALLGAGHGLRRASVPAAATLVAVIASSLIYVPQPFLPDRLRMELPAQLWLCALAGIGFAGLRTPWRAVAAAAWLASLAASRQPVPTLPWQAEHAALRDTPRHLPPGAVVAWDDHLDDGETARWLQACTGHRWVPLEEAPPGAWRWIGLADHTRGAPPVPDVIRYEVDTRDDPLWGCAPCDRRTVTLGLARPKP